MKRKNILSLTSLFFVYWFLMLTGCATPILKMPEQLPLIVKEYKHITLYGNRPGMVNTDIYLNKGDTYSILALGSVDLWASSRAPAGFKYHNVTPDLGWPLMSRIGKNHYLRPLDYSLYGTLMAYDSGKLWLGIKDGKVDSYGSSRNPLYYEDNSGYFSVDIIVWEKKDYIQIVDFFEKMKEKDPNNKAIIDALANVNRYKEYEIASQKASKEIEETKQEIQSLKEETEQKKEQTIKAEPDKGTEVQPKLPTVEASNENRVDQLEAKLAKLMETVKKLDDLKKKLDEERTRSQILSTKLSKVTKAKESLEKRLEIEEDVKQRLTISLKERESKYQKQQDLVASLYEKERQLKSKLFQLEETVRKSKENQEELDKVKSRAKKLNKKLVQAKQTKEIDTLKTELDEVLLEKSKLEKEAGHLKTKEFALKNEVNSHRSLAEKVRIEAENAKKELAATREQERQLADQVDKLKTRLNRGMAPVIVVSKPKKEIKIESSTTMLHLIVVDDRGIKNIKVYLNGKPVTIEMGRGIRLTDALKKKVLNKKELTRRLKLQYGQNTIRISATDTDGLTTEEVVTVIREKERGKIWAVVIGINNYQDIRNLKYAINDARAFKDYLTEYIGIPDDNIFFLTNESATRLKIQSLLGTKIKRLAGKDDTVIIFYAGHGAVETDPVDRDGDGFEKYLLPYDASLGDLYSTAIAMEEIKTIFQRIHAERVIFIADTCYSGASGGRTMLASKSRATLSETFFERISQGKGRVIISACSANEISKEDDNLKHGIFSYYLIDGLKGKADNDGDGIITVSELFSFLSRKVPEASGQDQHPVMKGETEGELVIGRIK